MQRNQTNDTVQRSITNPSDSVRHQMQPPTHNWHGKNDTWPEPMGRKPGTEPAGIIEA
mgnify:CR=1 FL=1|jgi:hypothetical protein